MKQTRSPRKLITAKDAALLLGYKSGVTVKRLIEAKELQGVRRPGPKGAWLVYELDVLRYRERFV